MTSTSGFTEGLSRVGLSRITTFKQKTNPWPEVHLSIGKSLCLLGKNHCWEAVGPAKDQFSQVHEPIRHLLESQHEQLNKGISVRKNIFLDVYMIGPTEDQARPTVIFSCENKIQRQRAQKLVRSSNILVEYTGFRLGDSSRPPRTDMSPRALRGEADSGMEWEPNTSELLIYHSSPIKDVYGIPIFIQRPNAQKDVVFRKSTVGGIISIHSKFFGLTVAHVFFGEDDEENGSGSYDAMELSLEGEDEEISWGSNEDDLIDITSRGSVSPIQDANDDSESSLSIESLVLDLESPGTPHRRGELKQVFQPNQNNQKSAMRALERIGPLTKTSSGSRKDSLDWALVEITSLEIFQAYRQLTTITHVKSIVKSLPKQNTTVASVTLSGGRTTGTITTNPTFMQLTTGIAFQEVWTVQLDSILGYGDCGSWVTSPDGQSLYGYITAGDPSTSIAYIIPAHQAFSDIELSMGGQITFPVLDALPKDLVIWSDFRRSNVDSSRNRTRNLFPLDYDFEEIDEISEAEGESLWDEVIGLVKRALSSRPTTPSDALSLDFSLEEGSISGFQAISNLASSEDFLNSVPSSSRANLGFGDSVKGKGLLPTICESTTPSFDAGFSSLPGNDEILSNINASAQPYGYNQQLTHQLMLYSGQNLMTIPQHNNFAGTKISQSPQPRVCWKFHPSRSKISDCVPGLPCELCHKLPSKLNIRNELRLNEPLESLAVFLTPQYLTGHFTKANVEKFVTMNATGWGKQSSTVRLTWGYQKLLDIEVVSLVPRQIDSFYHYSTVPSSNVTGLQLITKRSPPLGIQLANIDDMKYEYNKYIRDIVDGNLFEYLPVAYTDQESDLPERVLTAVCSYYTAASEKGGHMEILLRDAIEMHVAATILERSLLLDEKSRNCVEELLGEKFHELSAPRVAQRQIKLAIFMAQATRIHTVLKGWGNLMWKPARTTNRSQDWPTAICVFLMMVLVMDKTISASWYFCESNIQHGSRDAIDERKKFMKLVTLTQTDLFERCKEIFHMRYKTGKGGNLSFNPVRYGLEAWQKQVPNAEVKALTRDLQAIVQEFETEIRQHGSGVEEDEFLYAGRLSCIFLDDFISL